MTAELPFERPLADLRRKIEELKRFGEERQIDFSEEIARLEQRYRQMEEELYENLGAAQILQLARHHQRPTSLDYIERIFTDFIELHGDRLYADDLAIVGGIARLGGIPVTVIGHQRGKDTKDNIRRYFGSPHPEGFRKALRLMRQADKFRRPIITFIDTKGAYPGDTGGSGGALALGVGNRVLMLENAIYSVISPNGAASILWKDASKADQAAEYMKITAADLKAFGIVDEVVPEPMGGAHRNPDEQAAAVKDAVWRHLQELLGMTPEELIEDRFRKFRAIGRFTEAQPEQTAECADYAE